MTSSTRTTDPRHRRRAGRLACALLALLAAAAFAEIGRAMPAASQERFPSTDTYFGYEPGEERIYRIGPFDALAAGEAAEWRLVFRGLEEHVLAGEVARFEFSHVRFELIPGTWQPAEDLMEVRVEGSALLSRDGFPLEVDYVQRFLTQGERTALDGRRHVRFVYDAEQERYRKFLGIGRRDWDFHFGLPRAEEVDREALRGLFLYMPSSLACIGSSRGTCIESELAFANPGFVSMVLPYLLEEEKAERHFHFFVPSNIGGSPFVPTNPARWLSRERNNLASQDRYFERWKVKLGASADIEVGPRTLHAWEIDLGGGIDKIWIEPSGRVIRVDLETTFDNSRDRYIRLVFPHEEFLTPNSDPAEECCG